MSSELRSAENDAVLMFGPTSSEGAGAKLAGASVIASSFGELKKLASPLFKNTEAQAATPARNNNNTAIRIRPKNFGLPPTTVLRSGLRAPKMVNRCASVEGCVVTGGVAGIALRLLRKPAEICGSGGSTTTKSCVSLGVSSIGGTLAAVTDVGVLSRDAPARTGVGPLGARRLAKLILAGFSAFGRVAAISGVAMTSATVGSGEGVGSINAALLSAEFSATDTASVLSGTEVISSAFAGSVGSSEALSASSSATSTFSRSGSITSGTIGVGSTSSDTTGSISTGSGTMTGGTTGATFAIIPDTTMLTSSRATSISPAAFV